jgi:hypothetical protein
MTICLTNRPTNQMTNFLTNRPTNQMTNFLTKKSLKSWLTVWPRSDQPNKWPTD